MISNNTNNANNTNNTNNTNNSNKRATLFRLFWIFFKAGSFTFAGGLAMLPLIQKDVIDKYEMLDKDTFLDYAALSQTLPGIIALNCGVFVGRKVAGVAGAFAAGFGTVLPAFIAMLAATILLNSLPRNAVVENIFAGVRSASAALILYSALSLGRKNYKKLFPVALIAISFVLTLFLRISAYWIIIGAALAGFAYKMASDHKAVDHKAADRKAADRKADEKTPVAGTDSNADADADSDADADADADSDADADADADSDAYKEGEPK